MRFDRAFWLDARRRNFIYLSDRYGELPVYFNLLPFTHTPTLLCFYGGSYARAAAQLSDEQIVARAVAILTEIFGAVVTPPLSYLRTRWYTDPFARGSYSYVPVGASLADVDQLAQPVGERLLFAGEATVREYYGTVAAAMISGLREAKRLLGRGQIDLITGPAPEIGCS